jgi:hypothetical protein
MTGYFMLSIFIVLELRQKSGVDKSVIKNNAWHDAIFYFNVAIKKNYLRGPSCD